MERLFLEARPCRERATSNTNYKWWLVAMLWWIAFFNYADRQAMSSVFPLLTKEFHLSKVQLGLLGSSFAWTYGLCSPLAGFIVDRVRRKFAILGGLYAWSAICMATALSRSFAALVFFRAAEGLGETFYFPASVSLVSAYHDQKPDRERSAFTKLAFTWAASRGGYFSALIAQHFGWRSSFVVFGSCGVVLGLLLAKFIIEPKQQADAERIAPRMPLGEFLRELRRTPAALLLMAAFVCANFVATVLLSWMPQFIFDKFKVDLAVAGLAATIFVQLASMAGSPLGGWLADKARAKFPGGRMLIQAIGVFGGAPFVVLCGMTTSHAWLVVALIAWGLFKGLYDANIFAAIFDVIPPEARGTAAGFMNMVGWLGGGSAPLIVGYIADRSSLSLAISMTAAMYILAGTFLVIGMKKVKTI